MDRQSIKKAVREGYAKVAVGKSSCCSPTSSCGSDTAEQISKNIGYSVEDLQAVPEGANLGLGCGNPIALASLSEGETVLDLGSGAGFDCFLAAERVGSRRRVIGVDMTPEMLEKARGNAYKGNYQNVEFRLGEIEHLPVANTSVDVVISNCVINLSPDKAQAFREAFRVLKPGGRLLVSDVVLERELPWFVKNSVETYIGCLSGAILKPKYLKLLEEAGFQEVTVVDEGRMYVPDMTNDPTVKAVIDKLGATTGQVADAAASVVSIKVAASKPEGKTA